MTPEAIGRTQEPDSLEADPNYLAYKQAVESGQLAALEPGTFVVFCEGELRLIASRVDLEGVMDTLDKMEIGACFVKRVNMPERLVMLPQIVTEREAKHRARIGPNLPRRR